MPIHQKKNARSFERLRMATFRLHAFVWDPKSIEPKKGFSFVADFSDSGVGLYLASKLKPLEHVQIAFESENKPPFQARIAWCNRYSLEQNFIGHDAMNYRAGLNFIFASENERQRYLAFLQELKDRTAAVQPGAEF